MFMKINVWHARYAALDSIQKEISKTTIIQYVKCQY